MDTSENGTVGEENDVRPLAWPESKSVYLTLDLECDYGTATVENTYEAVGHVEKLVALLERHDLSLTCFVQTELLEERPEAVEQLREVSVPVSFHPHSHTHRPRSESSIAGEIERSTRQYRSYFGRDPTGYRFPDGDVRPEDYTVLSDHGYRFDASVFPTWRPGRFNNIDAAAAPQFLSSEDLVKLPFTVYRRYIPVPTALSYCLLFGRSYTGALARWPPTTLVLNVHMHDLVTPSTVTNLPLHYRALYTRTDGGLGVLDRLCERFRRQGYQFSRLDTAHEQLRHALESTAEFEYAGVE